MNSKLAGYLGLCARAGKISIGDTAMQDITHRRAKLVLLASDSSDRTQEKVKNACNSHSIAWVDQFTSEEISMAIGQYNRMVVAIKDEGLAKQILNCLK